MSDLIAISNLSPIKRVQKIWGEELWLVNNDNYCAKILKINDGWQCSKHYHKIKNETFVVLHGSVIIEFEGEEPRTMIPGDTLDVPAFFLHRFGTKYPRGAVVLEISTYHDDADVVRLEDSRKTD